MQVLSSSSSPVFMDALICQGCRVKLAVLLPCRAGVQQRRMCGHAIMQDVQPRARFCCPAVEALLGCVCSTLSQAVCMHGMKGGHDSAFVHSVNAACMIADCCVVCPRAPSRIGFDSLCAT